MTTARERLLPLLLTALVAALLLAPVAARASAPATPEAAPSFLIAPVDAGDGPYFTLELEPGASKHLTVALGNAGEASSPARTYAADVYTLVNGGFGIRSEDEPVTGTTAWLNYEAETLDIPPGRQLERDFTVTVPEDAEPGQHITGIVIQTEEPVAVGGSEMLRQNIVKAIAVFITVPGKIKPKLTVGEASLKQGGGANSLVVEVDNPGNVLVKPQGLITMTTGAGDAVLTAPVAMGSVYAGMSTIIEVPIPTLLAPGDYLVDVDLSDPETRAKDAATALPVTALDPESASTTPIAQPIRIDGIALEPIDDAATGALQVVNVTVSIMNGGGPLSGARLTLHVERDGEPVEDLPLATAMVVASGATEIAQRYVPLGRWEPGDYTFSATLEATDLTTGQITLLDSADAAAPVSVP